MRTLLVIVGDVLSQDSFEVPFAKDEDVTQALPPNGPHKALGKRTCLGRAYGGAYHAYAFRPKHLIKGARVLGAAVTDQEPGPRQVIVHHHVAGLLGDPGGTRMGGDPGQMYPARGEFDEE